MIRVRGILKYLVLPTIIALVMQRWGQPEWWVLEASLLGLFYLVVFSWSKYESPTIATVSCMIFAYLTRPTVTQQIYLHEYQGAFRIFVWLIWQIIVVGVGLFFYAISKIDTPRDRHDA